MCQNGLIYHNGKQVADFNESVNVGSVLQLSLGFHSVVKSSVFKK